MHRRGRRQSAGRGRRRRCRGRPRRTHRSAAPRSRWLRPTRWADSPVVSSATRVILHAPFRRPVRRGPPASDASPLDLDGEDHNGLGVDHPRQGADPVDHFVKALGVTRLDIGYEVDRPTDGQEGANLGDGGYRLGDAVGSATPSARRPSTTIDTRAWRPIGADGPRRIVYPAITPRASSRPSRCCTVERATPRRAAMPAMGWRASVLNTSSNARSVMSRSPVNDPPNWAMAEQADRALDPPVRLAEAIRIDQLASVARPCRSVRSTHVHHA